MSEGVGDYWFKLSNRSLFLDLLRKLKNWKFYGDIL